MPDNPTTRPVIYVHAKGRAQIDASSVQSLLKLDLPVCSLLAHDGLVQTENGYDQPILLLAEMARLFPGRPVVFMRAGLQPENELIDTLTGLLAQAEEPLALTLLSNANQTLNPFAGLRAAGKDSQYDLARLVNLLAPGQLHTITAWTDHFVMLSTDLVERIAAGNPGSTLMQELTASGGTLKAADHLFLHDPGSKIFKPIKLHPHETAYPPAFSELSSRLQDWFNAGMTSPPADFSEEKPVTLHITHSWGGGVAQWLSSFIHADESHRHYQLRSEDPQSGLGFGQKLSLYAGSELRCPIASWWLNPSISSINDSHEGYRQTLSEICNRYNIGRVFVSSLVGHSLDAFRSGLPTLQILHDHFPVWPLLGVSPVPYLQADGGPNRELALLEHARNQEFPEKDARAWVQISKAYLRALNEFNVRLAAPSQSVLDLQKQIEPAFEELAAEVIPHGFPAMQGLRDILPRPRKDGRLRLVILGRMQTGKGQLLLARALPELARYAQVYLLGTGKSGENFFGVPGVDVILEYQHDELPSILAEIGPDFAALLSVVPETFSYTLSELQQMCIPTIATRMGSFPGRIEHGKTGWLIDTDPQALVQQVAALHDSPDTIDAVRSNLPAIKSSSTGEMIESYNSLCPSVPRNQPFTPTGARPDNFRKAAAEYQRSLADNELQDTFAKQKTEWALETRRQLEEEQIRRVEWVDKLDAEVFRLGLLIKDKEITFHAALAGKNDEIAHHKRMLSHLESEKQRVNDLNSQVMESASWKITKPLRAGRRFTRNFMLARAWNPARWPWLISQLIKNLFTQGIRGTVQRLQNPVVEAVPVPELKPTIETELIDEVHAPDAFPRTEKPKASIVIPVFNQWNYTAACLNSLIENQGKYSFEVIVVDDQSSDKTDAHLAQIEGLTHLRNEENLGFVGSCNRGAQHARGEYLVLLNNDTQVTKGWLDELIDTFAREPDAGLVGSRLVYPDGSLQESGGIIFNDGSGWNYGRGKDAKNPIYHFLREVDYCSGACIALKTKYFHDLGALDERYAPAYYEDTDLAFRVRESGLKVLIQPSSVVVHFEGVTSGTDTSSGTKQYQLINQVKFVERWQTELKSQPVAVADPNNGSEILFASQHRFKGRILFIDATTPEPDRDSGSVRLTNLMQCMRDLGYGVTFFADNRAYAGSYTRDLQKSGVEVLYNPWLESIHEFFRSRGKEFDYIFISRHYIAINYVSLIKRYCPDARFIFDTVDLHYLREQRLAELENSMPLKRTAKQTHRSEMSVIKAADATLVVSTVEKAVLAKDAPNEKVHVLSNIHQVPGRDKAFADRKDIYFVGGYQHPPNIDAACWFVKEIWPLIHDRLPELRFHLIGSKAPERVRALEGNGVIFHGFVESIEPFLSDCRLAVAPLRYGAGVKGKVNMSMAHGQPVVATPAAVEGMFTQHGREVLVAEDARSFANEVIRLYRDEDLWNRISDASVENVEEHFSLRAASDSLTALFDSFE